MCRWSAAEIYSAAQGRRSMGPRTPRSSAAASLNRQHSNNRSMRRIDAPEPSWDMEPCAAASSDGGRGSPDAGLLVEGGDPSSKSMGERVAARVSDAADRQPSSEDSSAASVHEQPGMQSSIAHCQRRGSLTPRREAGGSTDDCAASPSGLAASLAHRSSAPSGETEVSDLLESRGHGLTFVVSHCVLRAAHGSSLARRLLIDTAYRTLQHISFNPMSAWAKISTDVLDIQITYHV